MRAIAAIRRPALARGRLRATLTPGPRLRRRAAAVLALGAAIVALYMLWLRDSSLVAVEQVTVTGITADNGHRIRAALVATAETMTTLHVDEGRLEEAVAAFPIVADVEARPDFPDGLALRVVERRPVAVVDAGGGPTAVAADGTLLPGLAVADGELPAIEAGVSARGGRLATGAALDAARVAGAAPSVIARRLETVAREGGRGVVVRVADGPEIVFGTAGRLAAKWAAAVRVLADEGAAGAAYVDVRIPERPAAGGFAADPVTGEAHGEAVDPHAATAHSHGDPAVADPYANPQP